MQKITSREELINKIRNCIEKELPVIKLSDFELSRIIYDNQKFIKDDFLHARKIRTNSRPDLLVLMKIIYNIQNLDINNELKFKSLKGIASHTLDNIIRDIRRIVVDFIFSNSYHKKYIKQDTRTKYQKETEFWKPEFNLFLDLWYAASLNNKGPITIQKFQKEIGNPAFSTPTKIGKCNTKYFYNLFKKLPYLLSQISQEDFKKVHKNLKRYIKIRNLSETYKDYSIYWDDEITKKIQITILLLRDLGIEILTLEKIPSISFNKKISLHDPRKFQRHHIFLNDKSSIDPNRLVLAVLTSHTSLEGLTNLLNDLLKERIKWNDKCPEFYQNKIQNAHQLWKEYLKRRDDLKNEGIEYFFRNYYPDVVNRFYKNVPKGDLELKIKQVIHEWINDGNPETVFPKYLLNRFNC